MSRLRAFLLSALLALPLWGCSDPVPVRDAPAVASALLPAADAALDLAWHDAARGRPVPVRLYWPPAAAEAPVPLVVVSHGLGGSRASFAQLGQHWAAQGYASLHVQHVGSDSSVWRGNVLALRSRLAQAAQEHEALQRVADLRFALDTLLAGEHGARVDGTRIAVAGHSYGALTALLATGARVQRQGEVLALRDARFAAAILMSAPPFYGEADFGPVLRGVTVPTLHLTTTEDTIQVPGYHSPPADRLRVFEAVGGAPKVLAVFDGGSHSVFIDRRGVGERPQRIRAGTQALSVAFLRHVFDRTGDTLVEWGAAHAPLLAAYRVEAAAPALGSLTVNTAP